MSATRPGKANVSPDSDSLMGDLAGRTLRGSLATIASQALRLLISIVATVVLARLLTPRDYGLIGMVGTVTSFFGIFKELGLDSAIIQRAHVTAEQISTLFWINAGIGLALTLVTVAIAPGVAWFYGEPSLLWITAVSALAFLFSGTSVQHEALLRRQMRFARLAAVDISSLLAASAVGIFLAWHQASYWALVLGQLAAALTRTVGLWLSLEWRPRLRVAFSNIRSMLAFGGNLTGFAFVNYFSRNLDNLLIGRYWGPSQLGLYSRAYQLLLLPIDQISAPITTVAVPALSRLADSPDRYRRAYLRILEKIAIVTMPMMAFLVMTSDWVVEIVLGPQWRAVSSIFALLGIVGIVQPVAGTVGWLFITQGRAGDMFRWSLVGGTLTIVSIVVGLPWGAMGVAGSYSLTSLLVIIPLMWWFVGRKGPVRMPDFYRTIAPSIGAVAAVMVALFVFRRAFDISSRVVGVVAAAGISGCVAFLVLATSNSGRGALRDTKLLASLLVCGRSRAL